MLICDWLRCGRERADADARATRGAGAADLEQTESAAAARFPLRLGFG